MYGILDISTSGMIAQRTRLTAISANLANQHSIMPDGMPYRARQVMFRPGDPDAVDPAARQLGTHVAGIEVDQRPFGLRWDPGNPRAIAEGPQKGYVRVTNVNPMVEQINAMQATRSYEANVAAAEATKNMMAQALRLIA